MGLSPPPLTGIPCLQQIPAELISLEPGQLGTVDTLTLEQQHQERVQRLVRTRGGTGVRGAGGVGLQRVTCLFLPLQGYDPQAKAKFSPRRRLKGRDTAGGRLKRRKKVAGEERRVGLPPPEVPPLLSGH